MKIPSKVKILNHTWSIAEKDNLVDADDEPIYGQCERLDQVILINKNMSPDNKRITLIHEMLHACRYSNGNAGLIPDFTGIPKNEIVLTWEHFLIAHYEEGLLSILRNNPKIIEYLLSND